MRFQKQNSTLFIDHNIKNQHDIMFIQINNRFQIKGISLNRQTTKQYLIFIADAHDINTFLEL